MRAETPFSDRNSTTDLELLNHEETRNWICTQLEETHFTLQEREDFAEKWTGDGAQLKAATLDELTEIYGPEGLILYTFTLETMKPMPVDDRERKYEEIMHQLQLLHRKIDKLMPPRKSVKVARALVQWSLVEAFIIQFFLPHFDLEMYRSYDVVIFMMAILLTLTLMAILFTLTLMAIDLAVIEGYGIDTVDERGLDKPISKEMKMEEAKELLERHAQAMC